MTCINLTLGFYLFSVFSLWHAVSCLPVSLDGYFLRTSLLSLTRAHKQTHTLILYFDDAPCFHLSLQLGDYWMDSCNWNIHTLRHFSSSPQVCSTAEFLILLSDHSYLHPFPFFSDLHFISQRRSFCLQSYLTAWFFVSVTGDTCVAMNQWVQNPTARTALDDILPCVDNATAQETLTRSKEVTSQLVSLMNTVITNISNNNFAPNFVPFYYNQSGPLVPNLCNPFNPDLTDRACAPGEVNLDNATLVGSIQ